MLTVTAFIRFVISPLFRKMGTMHETLNLLEIKKQTFKKLFLLTANELFEPSAGHSATVVRKSFVAVPGSTDRQGQ